MKQVPIDPKCDKLVHPVLESGGFGLCTSEIDPKTGHSEICPHGLQSVWVNFSTDEQAT
jgi:hypothetical protein